MNTYMLVWAPTGAPIGEVQADTPRAAVRKAPKPYSRFRGEIYATLVDAPQTSHAAATFAAGAL